MAYFSETQLPRYREEDLPGTVKKMYNFCRELQEMLQFVLANLDGDNIEGYEEIFNRLKDSEGNVSILKQTATEILMQVQQNGEKIGSLQVTAEQISARVQDTEKGVAELKITADGISQRVADNKGNIANLETTAKGISQRVSDTEGNITSLQTRAAGLEGRISDAEKNVTSIQATARGLETRVTSAEGDISSFQQTANGLSSRVSSMEGSISSVRQTADSLTSTVSDLNGKYTSIKQTVDNINLTGTVTFNDLETEGESVINGGNITTGNIDLESVTLSNKSGELTIGNGSTNKTNTRGAVLYGPSTAVYLIVTDAGCRMTAVTTHFYVGAGVVESSIAIKEGSDKRIKNTITYDVAERYGAFYRALKPARFHRNDGTSGRFHTGFIAQQIRDALTDGGLTSQDLAALVQTDYDPAKEDGGGGQYGIRYTELIPLNTAMIQQLMARVDALEAEVQSLKGGA